MIEKSSNHSKITGNFNEHLVMYWLSKNGYECVHVDHTGIDIIAANKITKEVLGISVKARSRKKGQIDHSITINKPREQMNKVSEACTYFGCIPYFAIVIDQDDQIDALLCPMDNIKELYGTRDVSSQNWNQIKLGEKPGAIRFKLNWN